MTRGPSLVSMQITALPMQGLDRLWSSTAAVNGFTRHAGTADYASDGEEAAKRVKVAPPMPVPPPPPPPATEAASEPPPPPGGGTQADPASSAPDPDGSHQNGHAHEEQPISQPPHPPGLGEPSTAAGYDPFSSTAADVVDAMDVDGLPPGISDGFRSTSLSHYVPLEPLPPPPMPSPGDGAGGRLTPLAPVTAIAANPGFGGAGRRQGAGPAAANGDAAVASGLEGAPVQPTDLVPADVDTLLRCVGVQRKGRPLECRPCSMLL